MYIRLSRAPLRARMSTYLHVPRAPGDTVCEHTVGEDVSIFTSAARPEVWGGRGDGGEGGGILSHLDQWSGGVIYQQQQVIRAPLLPSQIHKNIYNQVMHSCLPYAWPVHSRQQQHVERMRTFLPKGGSSVCGSL